MTSRLSKTMAWLTSSAISFVCAFAVAGEPMNFLKLAPVPGDFPFQDQSFRIRLQPGFFKINGDMFEDILKASGMVDSSNTIKMIDDQGHTDFLRYRNLKTRLKMSDHRLSATIMVDIVNAEFFTKEIEGCSITLQGPILFTTVLDILPSGQIMVDVPADSYHAEKVETGKNNCGFKGFLFASADRIRATLKQELINRLGKVVSNNEFKYVGDTKIDELLAQSRVFLNLPSRAPLDPKKTKSQFAMDLGIRGALAGTRNARERLKVVRSTESYLQGFGLEWAFDSGVQAMTQNIFDRHYISRAPHGGEAWPEWGQAPFQAVGHPIDFDAGVMLRASFLKSMFRALYQAGFFNIQLQDSLLDEKNLSIHPLDWDELFKMTLPDGTPLTADNYQDMRLEINMNQPPDVAIRDAKSLDMEVPSITLKIFVQAEGAPKEFPVLEMRAKFHLVTTPQMDENARLRLKFNDTPIESFEIISRKGVSPEVTDAQIQARLNDAVVQILNQATIELPFLKGHKVVIPYMGIDGDPKSDNQALAIYLKVK
jgi:hypothetical protein